LLTDRDFYPNSIAGLVPAAAKIIGFETVAQSLAAFFGSDSVVKV
jgi:hypothetical protein